MGLLLRGVQRAITPFDCKRGSRSTFFPERRETMEGGRERGGLLLRNGGGGPHVEEEEEEN